jgi:hypothetical protein
VTDRPEGEGIFLTTEELLSVFPRLKKSEAAMNVSERAVLLRIERLLYRNLSVEELEALTGARSPASGNGVPA